MKTERYVAKQDAKGWFVGDRWHLKVVSRHPSQAAAEYAANYWNRAWDRASVGASR